MVDDEMIVREGMKTSDDIFSRSDISSMILSAKREYNKEQKKKKSKKKKSTGWNPKRLFYYARDLLALTPVYLEPTNYATDANIINDLHDKLVAHLGKDIKNEDLKNYFNWWANRYSSRRCGDRINLRYMTHDSMIKEYVSYLYDPNTFFDEEIAKGVVPEGKNKKIQSEPVVGDSLVEKIKEMGIVEFVSGNFCSIIEVSDLLMEMGKYDLNKTMQRTINRTYKSEPIDFVSIAKKALVFHDLKDWLSVDYSDSFV